MEECDRVCKGAHGLEWQSLVTPDLRRYRAASVGNAVKRGISDSKRLGSLAGVSSPVHSITGLFSTTVISKMLPEAFLPTPALISSKKSCPHPFAVRKQVSALRLVQPFLELTLADTHTGAGEV